jgi:diguanylate cyclase (GGDEF)-like protein/PAS domain S-box-containing protein
MRELATSSSPRRLKILLFASALLPLLLFCGMGGYAVMQSRAQYEQRAELLTQNLSTAVDRNVSASIEKIDLALSSIVVNLEMQLAAADKLDLDASRRYIRSQTARLPELEGIRVVDAHGIGVLGGGIDGQPPVDFSTRRWFVTQRNQAGVGLVMSDPLKSKVAGLWIISFSRRFRGPNGEFAGCVTAAVLLSTFQQDLAAIDVGPRGSVILRDARLGLITRYPPTTTGSSGKVGDSNVSPELRRLAASGLSQATYHAKATSDAVERTVSFRRSSAAPMLVIVGVGAEDYLKDWYGEVRTVAGLCGGIIVLYAAGGLLLARVLAQNRQARQRIDLLAKVFEHSGEAIVLTDRESRIIEVNPAFVRQSGYAAMEIIGRDLGTLASGRATPADAQAMWEGLRITGLWRGELWDRTKDGREYPKWMSMSVLRDGRGEISHHIASWIDVTELKQAEEKILHLAHHDALTCLPNRVFLLGRLEQAMANARRDGSELAMLFIDMDRFKNINDTLGHHIGDGLLVEVGHRLQEVVRGGDIIARLGGDEFVLVVTGIGGGAVTAASVANKVMAALGRPYLVGGHELHSTPSIGISIFPADGEDADTLMKNADTAMYQAKSSGRNNFQFFTRAMNQATVERLGLEVGLRSAIERQELFLHYQPQVDLRSGRVVGVEALVRWQHPERGLTPPLKFIPIAEDTGQIEAIGAWVLEQALAQVARWRAAGHADLRVAVNLSAQQIRGDSFATRVAEALQRHALPGQALELEITESVAMHDPERTAGLLRQLRSHGVALAIDDFGTGYSSLAYLKCLPLSCLKLDRSFVMDIEHDPNDAAIGTATIQLAHSLGLAVVAEGVESQAQLAFLRELGCDTVQGYYISRPLAAEDCGHFLGLDGESGPRVQPPRAPSEPARDQRRFVDSTHD